MSAVLLTLAEITVVTSGVRQRVTTQEIPVTSITVQAASGNTGNIFVGDSNVSTTRGIELDAGQAWTQVADPTGRAGSEEFLLSDIYLDAGTSGDKARVVYTKRR